MPAHYLSSPPRSLPDVAMLVEPTEIAFGLVRIGSRDYYVAAPVCDEVTTRVRLYHREWDGPWYDVWETEHGLHGCTCRGWEIRCGRDRKPCRHIAGLYLLGLLSRFPPPGCARRPEMSTQLENAT